MKFPWANTLLLLFIAAELVSGLFGLLSGSPDSAVFMQVHRIAGYGILGTLLWKGVNVARSLRWPRARTARTASIVLLAALLITLGLGFAWAFVGPFSWLLFRRHELAHLRRRQPRPHPGLALHLPHQGISPRLLGGPQIRAATVGRRRRRFHSLAGRRVGLAYGGA